VVLGVVVFECDCDGVGESGGKYLVRQGASVSLCLLGKASEGEQSMASGHLILVVV
jgi:hypothetical protein